MVVKIIVLILGAGGIATLWEAVIADVGVALLAILNAVRIQRMKFYPSASVQEIVIKKGKDIQPAKRFVS